MRQSNGCSTSAPRSSAVKQWFEELPQKMKMPLNTRPNFHQHKILNTSQFHRSLEMQNLQQFKKTTAIISSKCLNVSNCNN